MKNDSTITLELLYAKNGSKKHLIFEKWEHFENSQNWPRGKGYRLCKIATLGQKLKMPKTCEKRFYNHIRVVLCKKRLQKTPNIRKMRAFCQKTHLILEKWEHFENSQNWPRGKGYRLCKIATLGQKLKMPKTCEKRFYNHIRVVVCKKRLEKTPNIRKMRAFWK